MQNDCPLLDLRSPGKVPSGACALTVMAKVPRVGAVKTRLVPPLNAEEAAALNICFLRDISANIAELTREDSIHGLVAYTPLGEESAFEGVLSSEFRLLPQRGANLGHRLSHAFEDLFQAGYETACLINSDSPTLPNRVLWEAVELLRKPGDRVVLGEAADGGYYLIGLKQAHCRLFEAIDWSTEKVFRQTLERASQIGLETKLLPVWYDVDDVGSLRRLCGELLSANSKLKAEDAWGYAAPHTALYLRQLLDEGAGPRLGLEQPVSERAV